MFNTLKKIIALILVLATAFTFAACHGDDKQSELNSVLILGVHDKMNLPDLPDEFIDTLAKSFHREKKEDGFYYAEPNFRIIIPDSSPDILSLPAEIDELLHIKSNTKDHLENAVRDAIASVTDYIASGSIMANDPETDMLGALSLAKISLDNMNSGNDKYICILDSFYSTAGGFNMLKIDTQNAETEEIVNAVPTETIPSLNGIRVQVCGLGSVASTQMNPGLKTDYNDKLVSIWNGLFNKTGAELVKPLTYTAPEGKDIIADEENVNIPHVSAIPFADLTSAELQILDSQVEFIPWKAELKDREQAVAYIRTAVQGVSEYLKNNPDEKVYVVGAIAKPEFGHTQDTSDLAQQRAETIAEILSKECGITNEMVVLNIGANEKFSFRNTNEYPDGAETSEKDYARLSALNRSVTIFNESSAKTDELIKYGYIQ